jgi:hypothetical protein
VTFYIVEHRAVESFAASDDKTPKYTTDVQRAYRFTTEKQAEKCRDRMPVPISWKVTEVEFKDGQVL